MLHYLLSEEMELLRAMQVIDREVFYYLCQRTNHDNGVIGGVCKVSYGGIAFDLSEKIEPGRKSNLWAVSSDDVRNSVRRLIKAGLLESSSHKGKMKKLMLHRVFFIEYLLGCNSVKNEVTSRLPVRLTVTNNINPIKNSELRSLDGQAYQSKLDEVTITLLQQHQQENEIKSEAFIMTLDWQPTGEDLNMILFRAFGNRYKIDDIDLAWVSEFVGYWYSQENRQYTQRQWTVKFGAKVVDYFRRPELFDKLRGVRDSSKGVYVEGNSHSLPAWARPPNSDNALIGWMNQHGYGDAPPGFDYQQTRGWLRRRIDQRVADSNLPKISH